MTYSFTDGGDGSLHVLRDGVFFCGIHGSEISIVKNTAQSVVELSDSEHVFISINVNQVSGATTLQDIVDAIEAALPDESAGGVGTLQTVTDAGNTTTNNISVQDGGDPTIQSVITPTGITVSDGGAANLFEASNAGVKVGDGSAVKHTINPDGSVTVGGSTFVTQKFHLTSAQIQTGNSVPIVLVAAAGAGTAVYAWHDTTYRVVNGVVPAVAGSMSIKSVGATEPQILCINLAASTSNPMKGDDSRGTDIDLCVIENANLIAEFDVDNPAFDGTIDIYLKYEIITL